MFKEIVNVSSFGGINDIIQIPALYVGITWFNVQNSEKMSQGEGESQNCEVI